MLLPGATAAPLLAVGVRPIVAIYSTFLQRAFDQIFQEVALQNLPVTFCLDRAGLTGPDGPTHHGCFDISYLRLFPNMVVMAPGDEADVGFACLDEFHYYGERDRGWAWQVPLLELAHTQFLLASATLGDMTAISAARPSPIAEWRVRG